MAKIKIDGIGEIEVGEKFRSLSAPEQQAIVDRIIEARGAVGGALEAVGKAAGDQQIDRWGLQEQIIEGMAFPVLDEVGAAGRAVGAGIAGLFGDEGPGMSETYDKALGDIRADRAGWQQRNPVANIAGTLTGAVAGIPGAFGGKIATAETLPGKAAWLAGSGALDGTAYGFTAGEGGLGNRLASAAEDAAIGAVAAPAIGGLAGAAGRGFQGAADWMTGNTVNRGVKKVLNNALNQAGKTGDEVVDAVGSARATGAPYVAADELPAFAGSVARSGEKPMATLKEFMTARQQGQGGRAISLFEKVFNTTKGVDDVIDDVAATLQQKAKPLYQQADTVLIPKDRVQTVLQDPMLARGLREGVEEETRRLRAQIQRAVNAGDTDTARALADDLRALAGVKLGDANTWPDDIPTRWLDLAVGGLDNIIGRLQRKGGARSIGSLIDLKRATVDTLEALNPAYGEARKIWAGTKPLEDAAEMGRSAFTSNMTAQEILKQAGIANKSPEWVEAFKAGLLDGIRRASDGADGINKVAKLLNNDRNRELFSTILSPAELQTLQRAGTIENRMTDTLGEIRGSPTAGRQAVDSRYKTPKWQDIAGGFLNFLTGTPNLAKNQAVTNRAMETLLTGDENTLARALAELGENTPSISGAVGAAGARGAMTPDAKGLSLPLALGVLGWGANQF